MELELGWNHSRIRWNHNEIRMELGWNYRMEV